MNRIEISRQSSLVDTSIKEFVDNHPDLKLSLNWSSEVADFLLPNKLGNQSDMKPKVFLDGSRDDRATSIMIADDNRPFDEVEAKKSFKFHESIDNIGNFFASPSEAKMPLLYAQLGCLSGHNDVVVLETLDVSSKLRQGGIGSEFIQRLLDMVKIYGFTQIVATPVNDRVVKFNKNNGFTFLTSGPLYMAMKKSGYYNTSDPVKPMTRKL